jgi:hypothetical protein
MKKHFLLYFSCLSLFATAQKQIKYETVFFEEKTFETSTLRINITGAVSEFDVINSVIKPFL